ncbi:hypothetical protein CH282_26205 [Rhodococcus sp. 06-418-1B]|nr:hypothetical protein [Rhodococcus sp. 06-418-1B]OZC76373.1 hypothetical protein CH282_26205 [Rhodococcus sp. 06-418-1B]
MEEPLSDEQILFLPTSAARIRARIDQSGLSVEEVAEKSGVHDLAKMLEDPETILGMDQDVAVARVLGINPEDLG